MVGVNARCQVGIQVFTAEAGSMAIHQFASSEPDLLHHLLTATQDPGKVHQLAQANHVLPSQGSLDFFRSKLSSRCLKMRGGYARGRHEVEVQRKRPGTVHQVSDSFESGDIGDLVEVSYNRGNPSRHHCLGILGRVEQ